MTNTGKKPDRSGVMDSSSVRHRFAGGAEWGDACPQWLSFVATAFEAILFLYTLCGCTTELGNGDKGLSLVSLITIFVFFFSNVSSLFFPNRTVEKRLGSSVQLVIERRRSIAIMFSSFGLIVSFGAIMLMAASLFDFEVESACTVVLSLFLVLCLIPKASVEWCLYRALVSRQADGVIEDYITPMLDDFRR